MNTRNYTRNCTRSSSSIGSPVSRLIVAVALAGTAASAAVANVTINSWVSSTNFQHQRVGVPDLDQKRVGLPNAGACYCAPTSLMNIMAYIANHGYPSVVPGVGSFTGYDTYYDITNLLDEIGPLASISPGGSDPDDPDCNDSEGDGGGDGECGSLPCGGKFSNVYNAMVSEGWFGNAQNDLVFTAAFLDDNAPPVSFTNLGQLAHDGNVLAVCYGRYAIVATTQEGLPVYKRGGGHCVTMNGIERDGGEMLLTVRDPGQDEGDIFGQSPFTTKQYDVSTTLTLVTSDDPEEGVNSWTLKVLPGLNEPHDDGVKRLLDGYFAVKAKSGVFWKDYTFVQNLPLTIGFGNGDPIPHPTPMWSIADLVLDQPQTGWVLLTAGSEVAPPQLIHVDPIDGSHLVLGATAATQLALSRFGEIFTITPGTATLAKFATDGTPIASAPVAGPPRAIAYDDESDSVYVLVPGTSGFGGTISRYPRSLALPPGSNVPSWNIAPSTQIGNDTRIAINPVDGRLWISSETADALRGFKIPRAPGSTISPVESIFDFDALTGFDFDDGGRLYAVDGGAVQVFDRNASGAWQPGDNSKFEGLDVGDMFRVARSRTNFDPAVHDLDEWNSIDISQFGPDGDPFGVVIPDCVGDLNGDSAVNAADLAVVLGSWGSIGFSLADLDGDDLVGAGDLAILLGAWGDCDD